MADATDDASAPATVTVGTTAVQLLANNPGRRRALVIQNVHASNDLYLGLGASANTVTTSNGIRIKAGETYSDGEPNCYSGPIYGIASGASTDVRVLEF